MPCMKKHVVMALPSWVAISGQRDARTLLMLR